MYWGWGFWGMSVFWWLFWVALIAIFFTFVAPVPRSRARQMHETPLDILRRRYASGELTTEEYEERVRRLQGQSTGSPTPGGPHRDSPPSQPVQH